MITRSYRGGRSLSRRFREARFRRFLPLIDDIIERKGGCRIADIGGSRYYWDIISDFVQTRPIEIHLINREHDAAANDAFVNITGDATSLTDHADNSFDFVHCNSVIEHVGGWNEMQRTATEIRRLAPAYYVQTPNFWFPYEPHFRCVFFHWLPEQIRIRLVMRFALGFADRKNTISEAVARVQSARLIDQAQMRALFPDAAHSAERVFGSKKSLIAIRS